KEKAKEIVNALDNLSDADKKTYTDALTNASKGAASAPDSNLKSIIEQAKAAQKTKQDAIDRIKELSNLTPDQKSELEKQIKEGTTSGVVGIEKKANDLNNAIPEAKNEITAKENSKNTINYKWADDNLKTAFDEKLKALKDLIASKDATAEQIKAAKKELQDAADALNGDQKHTALDNRINQLSNINETRRNELKEKIKTLDNYSEAEKLVTNAESLNEAIQKLKDKIAQAENTKNQEVYTLDSDTKKNEFNEAINSAKEELKAYQDANLTTLDDTAIKAKKTEIGTKVTNLQGEIDKLDGYRHAFKESLKDKWNLLTDNDFNTLNSMIDDPNFNKNPQDADKQTVLDKGLELAKNNATAKLIKQNYPNLSDADLQDLKNEVNVATLNSNAATTDTKFDDNVQAVLNKASQQNQEKQAKIVEIQNLSNLNQSQKDALVQEVKDSLHSQAENVLEKAKTLDEKMKQLKDKVG
ncbi:hypothetical protein C4M96_03950, partial [Mycoplasmopsis pullorum]|uniref:GA module-containing protein n=1 Tax=Mycoplasmopsis pullorum TaxID=48003 RepID=UPI001117C243